MIKKIKWPLITLLSACFLFFLLILTENSVINKGFDFVNAEIKIKSRMKNPVVKIGEKFFFLIEVASTGHVEVQPPDLDEKLKSLNIDVDDFQHSTRHFFDKRFYQFKYALASYKPGEYAVSDIKIRYKKENELDWREALIPKKPILVKSVLGEGQEVQDVRDIKGPIILRQPMFFFWVVFFILFISAGIFLYLLLNKKAFSVNIKKEGAHVIALRKIKELKKQDLISRGLVKEFYFQLSLIARRYLEDRFNLKAPEMTTEEFLWYLKGSPALSAGHKILLKEFLLNCDLVKFAKYAPSNNEIDHALTATISLIEQTKVEENLEERR